MTERQCPFCHRTHEVADDGTIATWRVVYDGDDTLPRQDTGCSIHKEDAEKEYASIERTLKDAMKWHRNKHKLRIVEERASWHELFEEPGIYNWMA